jgi:dihydroorotase
MQYDLLIKGGHVVDPGANLEGRLDVAIKGDRIAVVEADIPAEAAHEVIDADGTYVTPGLIDLHAHVFKGSTYWGIDGDVLASRSGVTTFLDPGSPAAFTIDTFRERIVNPSRARVYAFMNISNIGLTGTRFELASLEQCDPRIFAEMAGRNRDIVLGVKVRISTPEIIPHGITPLRRALEAGETCGLRVMMHIGIDPPELSEVVPLLRPGDIVTHSYTGLGMDIVDGEGRMKDVVLEARKQGVLFDLGHGAGSFSWRVAEAASGAGFWPDTLSSDVNQLGIRGPVFDLPTVMSKFLHLGMTLPEVIAATTTRPAEILGLTGQVGSLRPGCYADVALYHVLRGSFTLYDKISSRVADRLLRNKLTIIGGRVLPRQPHAAPAPWMTMEPFWPPDLAEFVERQDEIWSLGHDPDSMAETATPEPVGP